ncbi:MAG: Holliday junction resolvase RuvX [Acidobacteriota bacterium]|nr:Holliday junction resolvase RuvX [Acidobacteriota bacterium]
MTRYLGIDFGERRVGIAISDDEGRLSVPFDTLERASDRQIVGVIRQLADEEGIGGLVVGEPRTLDGEAGDAAKRVRSFAAKLEEGTGIQVRFIDEALTTVEAESRLREAGVPRRRMAKKRDALAAQILLQEWLDQEASR